MQHKWGTYMYVHIHVHVCALESSSFWLFFLLLHLFHSAIHVQNVASTHQPSVLYSGGQGVSSGIHVSPPSQMDTGGYLPPFLLGSPAAKSVSCQEA